MPGICGWAASWRSRHCGSIWLGDPVFQERFRWEAQSAASLNHRSIIAVYDTGQDITGEVPVPYLVMEYAEGRTLADLLGEGRRLPPGRALEITDGVLRALDHSHRNGIVHRDIKPSNVMVTGQGDVKVMDFGIARSLADGQATLTHASQVIGTAQYMSPEHVRGERVDARSDLYSAGCLLYELLTGRPPFRGESPVAIAYQQVRETPVPPSHLDPQIPPWADAIVAKAMAKAAAQRYQSAEEMRADVQRAMSGVPVSEPPPAGTLPHAPWLGGRPWRRHRPPPPAAVTTGRGRRLDTGRAGRCCGCWRACWRWPRSSPPGTSCWPPAAAVAAVAAVAVAAVVAGRRTWCPCPRPALAAGRAEDHREPSAATFSQPSHRHGLAGPGDRYPPGRGDCGRRRQHGHHLGVGRPAPAGGAGCAG